MSQEKKMSLLFLFFSLAWFIIMCSEFKGFEYTPNKKGQMTGQTLMMTIAGILFTFNLMISFSIYRNIFFDIHPIIFYLYIILHIIYIILWFFSNLWLNDDAKWGPWGNMNGWAKFHTLFVTILIVLSILVVILRKKLGLQQ